MRKYLQLILGQVEAAAYLLAVWSLLVLFLEPVISYYSDFRAVQSFTAAANLLLLALAILNRLLFKDERGTQKAIVLDVIMLVAGLLLMTYNARFVIFFLLIRQTYFILDFILFRFSKGRVYKWLAGNPPVTVMLSFLVVIFIGTVLLMLPVASAQNRVTPFIDALFTSTSATCVTGLIVVDTGKYFSQFGQIVILILLQIGGLGIMTVSTAFALLLGRNIDLKLKNVMDQMVGGTNRINVAELLKNIVLVTVILELIGALLLFSRFHQDLSLHRAIYVSVFHSISAFCNAGFSLFSDNLAGFRDSAVVSLAVPLLIFLGGIGFTVIIDLFRFFFKRDKVRKLSLHSKIVLTTSGILILIGMIAYFVMEYQGTMNGFGIHQRLLSSFFQSVTTRTAGFNTINIGALSKGALLVSMVLMFIGASPGSTGGGIKTSTFSVLGLMMVSLLKGKRDISVFKRRIPLMDFREAAGLVFLSAVILFVIVVLLLQVEPFSFDKILFEAFSAFGTVGLSTGITSSLSPWGRILITILMYLGRIGPLTVIYAFAIRSRKTNINYAEETIAIG
ncbi:MAG: TrkH family potassium uptake protein [Candidatus Cloacimonetes bacterium]|nr:TrkH family potassium uptake protein [Candidatus Cloacimonadota bacterium]